MTGRLIALVLASSALCLGCGESGPKLFPVAGSVTWNGAPLENGDILFTPADGSVPIPGKIQAGRYALQSPAGKMKVEIRATREGALDPVMGARSRTQFLPPRYNDATELTAEVLELNPNEIPFELTETVVRQ